MFVCNSVTRWWSKKVEVVNTTKDFRVLRIGTSIRVNKQSFDNWFAAV